MQGEHQEAVPCVLLFRECDSMRVRPTQQFYYARHVCVPVIRLCATVFPLFFIMRGVFGAEKMTADWCYRNDRCRNDLWVAGKLVCVFLCLVIFVNCCVCVCLCVFCVLLCFVCVLSVFCVVCFCLSFCVTEAPMTVGLN